MRRSDLAGLLQANRAALPASERRAPGGLARLSTEAALGRGALALPHDTNVTVTGKVNVFFFLSSTPWTASSTALPRAPA